MTLNIRAAHAPKNSPIDCDGAQLTNAQCSMVPISVSLYREAYIQLKYTIETKQELITTSHYSTHRNGHTNFWYVYIFRKSVFQLLNMQL